MDRKLLTAARSIERKHCPNEVFEIFQKNVADYGFSHIIYVTVSSSQNREIQVLSNLPEDWANKIRGDETAFDPFLEYCCSTYEITLTGVEFLEDYPYLDEKSVAFIKAAGELGFKSGLGIPMRLAESSRYGGFNIGTGLQRAEFERVILPKSEMFRAFCLIAHRRIEELRYETVSSESQQSLSPREKECISLMAAGQRIPQIAEALGVSVPAIRLYLRNARNKLGATTKEQAVAHALQKGLLDN